VGVRLVVSFRRILGLFHLDNPRKEAGEVKSMTLREFLATHQRRPHLPTHVSGSLEDWLSHGELDEELRRIGVFRSRQGDTRIYQTARSGIVLVETPTMLALEPSRDAARQWLDEDQRQEFDRSFGAASA